VVDMLRTVNLSVEVFVDEDDDGTIYAEALMLRNHDKRLLAQGFACLSPPDPPAAQIADEQVAALALTDLARTLVHGPIADGGESGRDASPPPDGATVVVPGCARPDSQQPPGSPPDTLRG
jgi:hypothetical protein